MTTFAPTCPQVSVPASIPGGIAENEGNLSPEGGRLYMNEGTHDLLFYNNDTEYIVFNDIAALTSARATTRSLTRGSFEAMHADERTVNQPDMLYGAYIGSYEALPTQETVSLPVRLQPLTYTYLVRYEFQQGLQYVALARGALAGMAESVYLNDGHTGPESATVMFDCTLRDYGPEATVKSFGIPDYPGDHYGDDTRTTEHTYHLNLEVRLHNGAMKTFEFDVTDQVKAQPRGGVIIVSDGLVITDEEGRQAPAAVSTSTWRDGAITSTSPCHCKKGDLYKTGDH